LKAFIVQRIAHLRTAAWSSAEYLFYPLLLLLSTPVFLRFLGEAEFGLWMLVVAISALSGATNLGMGAATIKFVSEGRGAGDLARAGDIVRQTLGFALGAGGIVFALLMLGAPFIAESFLSAMGEPARVTTALRIGGAVLLVQQAELVFAAALKGSERFDVAAKIEIGMRFLLLGVNLLAAWYSRDAITLLFATLGMMCLSCVVRGYWAGRVIGSHVWLPRWTMAEAGRLVGFAGWSWVQSMASALFQVCDRLIVGAMLGASALAAYTVCTQLAQQVHALPAAAMAFLFPLISRRLGSGNASGARRIRRIGVAVNLAAALGLGAILAFGSGLILSLWMGEAFSNENSVLFVWIVAAYALVAVNVAPHYLLMGHGDVRFLSIVGMVGGAASLLAMYLLIPPFGLLGAAWGRLLYGAILMLAYARLSTIEQRTDPK
jgi:O-antigen/teichoic acid export membrane protein